MHGQNCLGTASFVAGHATSIFDNDCVVYGTERVDDLFENCDGDNLKPNVPINGYDNRFYTQNANASATCDCCGLRPLAGQAWAVGIETNATSLGLPSGHVPFLDNLPPRCSPPRLTRSPIPTTPQPARRPCP